MITDLVADEGPIPFERFMDLALYGEGGFFAGKTLRSDRTGDFMTSPEVSSLFGETLARYVDPLYREMGAPFVIVEVGSGSGSLIRPLVERSGHRGVAVEVSPAARDRLRQIPGLQVESSLSALDPQLRGLVVANELLDNLPMALAQNVDGEWRERWVGHVDGKLEFVDVSPREEVGEWLRQYASEVPERGWVEVQLEAGDWLRRVSERLDEGAVLVIDYGDTTENLLPRRAEGTLRTYREHHLGPDPLLEPGTMDITADVNFTALCDTALGLGFETSLWRQDDFLTGLGLRRILTDLRREEMAMIAGQEMERMLIRSRRIEGEALLHPRGLGDFRVLELRRGVSAPLDDGSGAS